MGLRLKCPGCNATNPIALRVCPACGRSLDNLPPEQRVYVIEPLGAAARKPSPPPSAPAAKPAAAAAPAPAAKKPRAPRKKKA